MLKIFAWVVSNDGRFVESAIEILERQHNGLQLVGKASGDDIAKIDGVGGGI